MFFFLFLFNSNIFPSVDGNLKLGAVLFSLIFIVYNFADVILKEYYLANYNLNYNVNRNLDFYFNIENIFNENYEQAYMYSTMDRALNLGIRSKF